MLDNENYLDKYAAYMITYFNAYIIYFPTIFYGYGLDSLNIGTDILKVNTIPKSSIETCVGQFEG